MAGLAFSSLRVREKYSITNHGEVFHLELVRFLSHSDCEFKDIYTLELIKMSEIVSLGKGKDWEIREYQVV